MSVAADHRMPINDIHHAWSEKRTRLTSDGVGPTIEVFVGICTCGHRIEATDAHDVMERFFAHRQALRDIEAEES